MLYTWAVSYAANPGGTLPPGQIYDRDELTARLWRTLTRQSVYLSAERRMGKTSVLRKMLADPPPDVAVVACDLEKVASPAELVEALLGAINERLPQLLRARGALRRSLGGLGISKLSVTAIGSVEFRQSVEPQWSTALERVLQSLQQVDATYVVLFLDEVAYGLSSIARTTSPRDAQAILDHLRAARQTDGRLRMLYASSIGLHHVLGEIGAGAGSWAPINDLMIEDVGPFTPNHAKGLARALIEGEAIPTVDPAAVAAAVADVSDGVPYYIHHIVRRLLDRQSPIEASLVEEIVAQAIDDPYDAWGFEHYVTRLEPYYGDDAPLVGDMLDIVAVSGPLPFDRLLALLSTRREVFEKDRDRVRRLTDLLQKDHYLVQEGDVLRFRLRLVARAWARRRHLGAP